jgi:GNAT superfamily N-acetyltransferase
MAMDTSELIAVHLRLECIEVDEHDLAYRVPCPNPDTLPRFYIAQHTDSDSFSRFVRHDVPESLRRRLLELPPREALYQHDRVQAVLGPHGTDEDFYFGESCTCPSTFTPRHYPDVIRLTEDQRPLIDEYDAEMNPSDVAIFAAIVDGRIASTCQSSRENETAAEAWVRTLPQYRRRGLARQVTAAWIACTRERQKLPFYTYRMENQASRGVARSLGLTPFIIDAAYP